jgi:hypothetical protein
MGVERPPRRMGTVDALLFVLAPGAGAAMHGVLVEGAVRGRTASDLLALSTS